MLLSNHHDYLKLYCLLSILPNHTAKIKGAGVKYRVGGGSQGKDIWVGGVVKGSMFEKYE